MAEHSFRGSGLEANPYDASAFQPVSGSVGWSCPSNIAIIKYWGKREVQLPMNPSLSMTLQEARTTTCITYEFHPGSKNGSIIFTFEGQKVPAFESRIQNFLETIQSWVPVLAYTHLEITSENSFPHSSGIASSASSLGALALCLVQIEEQITGRLDSEFFKQKSSFIARLGSGSASRSVYPHFALWGESARWEGSSDLYAIPVHEFHQTFLNMRDSILIVESGQKKVSSSAGHSQMEDNPFSSVRFSQARENLGILKKILLEGNWNGFIALMEEEALSLHAMMMTGRPGYLLMKPGTLSILQSIREFRRKTGLRLGFTLDAGANVHLLHAEADADPVEQFINSELVSFCENEKVITDQMGSGPETVRP